MRLFTGLGDGGETDLLGARVAKSDARIATLGALDEASSAIGFGRALATTGRTRALLIETQRDLYRIMAELAFTAELRPASFTLGEDRVRWLEAETDGLAEGVDLPADFILPGESAPGAAIDLARTTVRRAERQAVALAHSGYQPNPAIISYLNRLSSLLFIAARVEDHAAGRAPRRAKKR